jgi:hypothetical protein
MPRRRSFKPPKEKKPPFEPERLLLVEKAIQELIAQAHPGLERAKVVAINRPGKAGRSRCDGMVKLRTATTAERALVADDIGDIAYVVEVRTQPYEKLGAEAKKRRLDHALSHAAGTDKNGRWVCVDQHDLEEFSTVLDRHGPPDDNPAFTALAKQMALFAKGKGA